MGHGWVQMMWSSFSKTKWRTKQLFSRRALAGRLYVADDDWGGDHVAAMYGAAYQAALAELAGGPVRATGSGRTDAGVHTHTII